MLELDGSAGGGQLVRTALALSAATGRPFRMTSVRGARDEPGLRAQHLAAVRAAAEACDAAVEGDRVGSETLTFEPGGPPGGEVRVEVGTAGSLVLVFDALLPLAPALDGPLDVTVTAAGTDVPYAPPFDYFERVKLPLLAEFGLRADVSLGRRGFYPAGDGRAALSLRPSALDPVVLTDRGSIERLTVYSRATTDLRGASVAERQAERVASALAEDDGGVASDVGYVPADSTGSVVVLVAEYGGTRAGFGALGEPGKPSEAVAEEAVEAFEAFDGADGTVDRHLADQVLPFLALAGGRVTTAERTRHVETCRAVLEAFDRSVAVEADGVVTLEREP